MGGGEDVGRDVSLNVSVVAGQPVSTSWGSCSVWRTARRWRVSPASTSSSLSWPPKKHSNGWIREGAGGRLECFFFEKLACFEYSRNIRLCPGSHHHPGRSQRGPLTPGQRLRPCHHLVAEERVKTKPQIQNIAGITPPWHNPRGRILWRCGPMIGSNSGTATEDLNYLMSSLKD